MVHQAAQTVHAAELVLVLCVESQFAWLIAAAARPLQRTRSVVSLLTDWLQLPAEDKAVVHLQHP